MNDIENNKSQLVEESFVCRQCGNKTSHSLLYRHDDEIFLGYYGTIRERITMTNHNYFFQCKTCKGFSLKNITDDEIDNSDDIDFDKIHYIYPSVKTLDKYVPIGLRLVMKEAQKVKLISSMAYLVLIRKVLEELCRDKNIKEKNLHENLKKLVAVEKLPLIFAEASNNLRLLGNIGAHEPRIEIRKSEIQLVEEFIFALIEYIYVMPSKLDKLNKALKQQKA